MTKASSEAVENASTHRRLQRYSTIQTYQPETLVTDNAAMDLDLAAIKDQFEVGTKVAMGNAEWIYREGAFSHPVARLQLDSPLPEDIPAGTRVSGLALSSSGGVIEARTRDFSPKESTELFVEYAIYADQLNYAGCLVGANPVPTMQGCFVDSGALTVPEFQLTLTYTYNPQSDNFLFRSFEGFSVFAQDFMGECEGNCPYAEFQKFYDYYGVYDYGDNLISAAFDGSSTFLGNGNMDFGLFGNVARAEYIERAIVTMNLWMWIIRQMNFAIDICEGSTSCPAEDLFCGQMPGLHAWDRAVAYYTGSLSTTENSTTSGNLLYTLANEQCSQFSTCSLSGTSAVGESLVNIEIFDNFRGAQRMIMNGDCEGVKDLKDSIVALMTIPLIQGTLRYAHLLANEEKYWSLYGAEAAAFASSVLPLVHQCDPDSANVIHDNLKVQANPKVDFYAVKRALEKNYHCLKVSCKQVGGINSPFTGGYLEGAEPCIEFFNQVTVDFNDDNKAAAIGLTAAILMLLILGIAACLIRRTAEKRIQEKNEELNELKEPSSEIL
ncbi:hypothetical protein IV203_037815 [Nitzschia inconspicua]|uniref:Uncharacterized protein n=1 Tax=Nitzschia inconspicua TaxID=303405 RepID=A0A9K3LLN3_9STRA|nr:hypothetical protein IV203_037815 [Nitzschia inconspicua]